MLEEPIKLDDLFRKCLQLYNLNKIYYKQKIHAIETK